MMSLPDARRPVWPRQTDTGSRFRPPQQPRAPTTHGVGELLRVRAGGIDGRRRIDRTRSDVRLGPRGAGAARSRVLRGRRRRSPPRSRPGSMHGAAPSVNAVTCMPIEQHIAGDSAPLIRHLRSGRATRCCSASQSRPSPSQVSPRSLRIRGRSSSGPNLPTATTGGTPGCSRSSARSRAVSTRRWRCRGARWRSSLQRVTPSMPVPTCTTRPGTIKPGCDWLTGWISGDGQTADNLDPLLVACRAARTVDG